MSELRDIPRSMLEGLYRVQGSRLRELQAMVDEQARQLAELRAEVARLHRRLSRNSGNSSMPPSSDGLLPGTVLPEPSPAAATRRRGRQPGAPGAALRWAPDAAIEDHRPHGPCAGCGADLAHAPSVRVVRAWQVTDIPVVTATVTEHRVHAVVCGCGRATTADVPAEVADAACCYGPNLAALIVYLLVVHALPVERAAGLELVKIFV